MRTKALVENKMIYGSILLICISCNSLKQLQYINLEFKTVAIVSLMTIKKNKKYDIYGNCDKILIHDILVSN